MELRIMEKCRCRLLLLPVPGGDDGPAAVGLGAQRHRLDRVDDGEEAVERHEDQRVDAHVRRRDCQVLHQLAPAKNVSLWHSTCKQYINEMGILELAAKNIIHWPGTWGKKIVMDGR